MNATSKKGTAIWRKLRADSQINYEKVAARMRLAMKIADAIEKSGMTKKQFAEKMGKCPSEISRWLSGTHNFTYDTLYEISGVLGIKLIDSGIQNRIAPITDNRYEAYTDTVRLSEKNRSIPLTTSRVRWNSIPYILLPDNNLKKVRYGRC